MTILSRTSLAFVVLSFALLGAWTAGDLLGHPSPQQKKRVEEEEEAPKAKKPKRKVIRVEDEEKSKTKPETNRPAAPSAGGDLAQLAEQARHPALKELFRSLAVPHDRLLFQRSSVTISGEQRQREEKILPTPFYFGTDPGRYGDERFRFTTLTKDFQPDKPLSRDPKTLESVRCYEEIAQDKVQSFLRENYDQRQANDRQYLSRYEMLRAAEQALSSVRSWHLSAIQTGKRRGAEWNKVEEKLQAALLNVLLGQMNELAKLKDWQGMLDLARRLAVSYSNTDKRIFEPIVGMLQQAIRDETSNDESKQEAFKRLHELEMEFPHNPAVGPLSKMLQTRAKALLETAKDLARDKNNLRNLQRAREYLKQVDETWPQVAGSRELHAQIDVDYPILHVGVRGPLPKYLSPAWACTDNEHRVVELLFESLVKSVPDGAGGFRYRPALAESPPKVWPLGRKFELPRNAFWSDGRQLMFTDIEESLKLLSRGEGVGLSRAWGELLDAPESMRNPFQLILRLKQGFRDSLAPMTFKILPRPGGRGSPTESEGFAIQPTTSGPFRLGRTGQSDETIRLTTIFVANPTYGQRPGKQGAPFIQEIRFYSYTDNTDLAKELSSRKLDMVLDLTAKQAEELQNKPDIVVPLPSPAVPNRRIYFLAVNTRKVEDSKLRQALSSAIDREDLLNKHFRGSLSKLHKALTGPFPAGSWACKSIQDTNKDSQKLFDPDRAKLQKLRAKAGPFQLKYAADNPSVDEAMKDLCAQVKKETGVVLEPTPCTPYELRYDVEKVKNYDVAYYHYDFPDEIYWLAPLFKPPPGSDDANNIFKYQNAELMTLLEGTKNYRTFAKVQEHQQLNQDLLNREMPLIPLWQLDPLLAYRSNVKPSALDPLLVFDNIEEWRLQPK